MNNFKRTLSRTLITLFLALSLVFPLAACNGAWDSGGAGPKGEAGKSAYELAVENGFPGTLSEWLDSLKSPDAQGISGKSAYDLAVENGFTGTLIEWLDSLQPGEPGKNAYELAVDNGFAGTLSEWLDSLKAPEAQVLSGLSAYELAVENGFTGTMAEWIASLQATGTPGSNGLNAYELAVVDGYEGTLTEWLASLKASDIDPETLYAWYITENPGASFAEFVSVFALDPAPAFAVAQKILRSAVSIRAGYTDPTTKAAMFSAGAGVILDIDRATGVAHILTNYHVIYERTHTPAISQDIRLAPYGREWFGTGAQDLAVAAEFVGGSVSKDIAVLRTAVNNAFKDPVYRPADLGDSDTVAVGETALAVGNPEADGLSVTRGIVNVDSETIEMRALDAATGTVLQRVIRVDTAINGGNSGGGLFNGAGQLIGIVNAKTVSEKIDNIGYAIPAAIALGVVDSVLREEKQDGIFVKYLVGITTQPNNSAAILDEQGILRIKESVAVIELTAGRPAATAGSTMAGTRIRVGDVLVSAKLTDRPQIQITRHFQLSDYMYGAKVGDKLTLTVLRGGFLRTLADITISKDHYAEL
ncbi:MAG: S1C family serine protease [Firmicutes bacterium]|nr:S1C family serine protease [Bacillota bacterium]